MDGPKEDSRKNEGQNRNNEFESEFESTPVSLSTRNRQTGSKNSQEPAAVGCPVGQLDEGETDRPTLFCSLNAFLSRVWLKRRQRQAGEQWKG